MTERKPKGKKPGIKVNTTKGKPLIFTVQPSTEPVTIAIWGERKGQLRIRATKRLTFPAP